MRRVALRIRPGDERDEGAVLALFDEAIAWLVARGQTGQWGALPFSQREDARDRVHQFAVGGGLHVGECDGRAVAALVVGEAPAYAPKLAAPELYIPLLLTSRRLAGRDIGGALVRVAVDLARRRGAVVVRVDCWAGAPGLIAWYERQGFVCCGSFEQNGWVGQIFKMTV